jgi:hypothetical protein
MGDTPREMAAPAQETVQPVPDNRSKGFVAWLREQPKMLFNKAKSSEKVVTAQGKFE